jgi:preprotein translocase subunit SecG
MSSFLFYLSLSLFLTVAACLILLVLAQRGHGGGLSGALGGRGGSVAFGTKTDSVLRWATSVSFFALIALAILLSRAVH